MKARLLLSTGALALSSLFFSSCKKNLTPDFESKVYQEKINKWVDSKVVSNTSGQAYSTAMKQNLDYAHMHIESSTENEKIVVIPIKDAFLQSRGVTAGTLGNLVVLMKATDDIRQANIALFKPDEGTQSGTLPENTFQNIFNTAKVNVNGTFRFLDLNGHLQYQLGYKNGKMISAGTVQRKTMDEYRKAQVNGSFGVSSPGKGNVQANDITCEYYFLIIDWYNSAGQYVYTSWSLIGSNCYDTNQVPQGDNPGGGGGTFHGPDGSTWNGSAQYEYAVTREWEWTAYSLPYGWITSTEQVTGKKVNGYPDGGYFTGVTHTNSVSTDATHSWNQTMWNYYISSNLLYLYLYGDITGPSVNTTITESRSFAFSALF